MLFLRRCKYARVITTTLQGNHSCPHSTVLARVGHRGKDCGAAVTYLGLSKGSWCVQQEQMTPGESGTLWAHKGPCNGSVLGPAVGRVDVTV